MGAWWVEGGAGRMGVMTGVVGGFGGSFTFWVYSNRGLWLFGKRGFRFYVGALNLILFLLALSSPPIWQPNRDVSRAPQQKPVEQQSSSPRARGTACELHARS